MSTPPPIINIPSRIRHEFPVAAKWSLVWDAGDIQPPHVAVEKRSQPEKFSASPSHSQQWRRHLQLVRELRVEQRRARLEQLRNRLANVNRQNLIVPLVPAGVGVVQVYNKKFGLLTIFI